MHHRPPPRVTWPGLLAVALALSACQVASLGAKPKADGPKQRGASPSAGPVPSGGPAGARPQEDATSSSPPKQGPLAPTARPGANGEVQASAAGKASLAALTAQAPYAIPARTNLPLPPSLLGPGLAFLGSEGAQLLANDGGGLIANQGLALLGQDGGSLLANDGGGLLATDGGGLLANDGGGLLANDGGGIVASGAGNFRLQQAGLGELGVTVPTAGRLQLKQVFPIADQEDPVRFAQGQMLLYALQAASLNAMLDELGRHHWRPQVPVYLQRLMPGAPASEPSRLNAEVGPGGPGGGPVFWIYNAVGAHLARQKDPTAALPMRSELPDLALQITGKGQGRAFWMPGMAVPTDRMAFASDFDLAKRQVNAELIAIGDADASSPSLRRVRWRFDLDPQGALRIRVHSQAEGPGVVASRACRRLLLHLTPEGPARLLLAQGPHPGALAWSSADGQATAATPQAMALPELGLWDRVPVAEQGAQPSLAFPEPSPFSSPMAQGMPGALASSLYQSWPAAPMPPQRPTLLP